MIDNFTLYTRKLYRDLRFFYRLYHSLLYFLYFTRFSVLFFPFFSLHPFFRVCWIPPCRVSLSACVSLTLHFSKPEGHLRPQNGDASCSARSVLKLVQGSSFKQTIRKSLQNKIEECWPLALSAVHGFKRRRTPVPRMVVQWQRSLNTKANTTRSITRD